MQQYFVIILQLIQEYNELFQQLGARKRAVKEVEVGRVLLSTHFSENMSLITHGAGNHSWQTIMSCRDRSAERFLLLSIRAVSHRVVCTARVPI